jgi:hypothetical protein
MAFQPTCFCPECGGRAKLLESRPLKSSTGRRRRYGCLDPSCRFRWTAWVGERTPESSRQAARASGGAPGAAVLNCFRDCLHWGERCGLGIPEAASDPTFASICPARMEHRPPGIASGGQAA